MRKTKDALQESIRIKRNELKQKEIRKKEIQLHLQDSYLAEQDVFMKIKALSEDIETLQQQIVQTNEKQDHTKRVLARQAKEVLLLKNELREHEKNAQQRVRSIYKILKRKETQSLSFLRHDFSFKNINFVEFILGHEVATMQDFYKKKQSLQDLLGPYQQRKNTQEQLYQKAAENKQLLEQKQQEHQRLLVNIQQDRQIYYRYLEELQQSMGIVADELRYWEEQKQLFLSFQNTQGLLPLKGKLKSPIKARIIQPFRAKKKNINKILYHGITLEAPKKSVIHAIAPGKVVFADTLPGYLQLIIVDHGKESFSVYGKLSRLKVSVGEFVAENTPVGFTSQEPVTSKFRAYFEIRYKGKSVDPLRWLKPGTYKRRGQRRR
ncbi:MAG: peptidoglycan DD-metalloendopeptidase family protein [SAR324 cluster bacterium]|nr:peptidoglycan DD-metalloendopeptidase family protein [SAR324 cluster bacterium]